MKTEEETMYLAVVRRQDRIYLSAYFCDSTGNWFECIGGVVLRPLNQPTKRHFSILGVLPAPQATRVVERLNHTLMQKRANMASDRFFEEV